MAGPEGSIEERLARLERRVDALQRTLDGAAPRTAATSATPRTRASEDAPGRRTPGGRPPPARLAMLTGQAEGWLAKGGIGLVALGLVFLFQYSIEQGWITPPVRVLVGFGLGVALYVAGSRVRASRLVWGQVAIGGALGLLYLTVWAAAVLYGLIPHWAGFAALAALSADAVRQADRADRPTLGVIGGGFAYATPILLSDVGHTAPLLVLAYAVLVAAALAVVFLRRGWLSLQLTAAAGAFLLLGMAGSPEAGVRALVQLTVVVLWLVVSIVPLVIGARGRLELGLPIELSERLGERAVGFALRISVLLPTLAAVQQTAQLWTLGRGGTALLLASGAAAYAAIAGWGWRSDQPRVFGVAAETSALLALFAIGLHLRAERLVAATAAALTVMHVLARRTAHDPLRSIAHLGFFGLAVGLAAAFENPVELRLGLAALVAIACAAAVAPLLPRPHARAYALGAYAFLLFWLLWVTAPLPNGTLLGSALWGGLGALALVAGATRRVKPLEQLGLVTLGATAAKMLLFDLAEAETIWRIALFLGFGMVLLGLGYYLRTESESESES